MSSGPLLQPAIARDLDDEPALLWLLAVLGGGRLAVAVIAGETLGAEPTLAAAALAAAAVGAVRRCLRKS